MQHHPIWLAQAEQSAPPAPFAPAQPQPQAAQPEPSAPDLGFRLPGVGGRARPSEPAPTAAVPSAATAPQIEMQAPPAPPASDTSARDLAIGGAVLLVLMVIFFFARNAYTQHLVVRRVAPSAAGSAGWLLFAGLPLLSAAAVLAAVNAAKYLSLLVTAPLLVAGVAALVGALLVGRR
jgi:hypothetical protein